MSQLKGNDRRYTSKETENEVLQIIAFKILRKIADEIQTAEFFTIKKVRVQHNTTSCVFEMSRYKS